MQREVLVDAKVLRETPACTFAEVSVNTEDGLHRVSVRLSKASSSVTDDDIEVAPRSVASLEQHLRREHPEWGRLNVRVQGDPRQLWLAFP